MVVREPILGPFLGPLQTVVPPDMKEDIVTLGWVEGVGQTGDEVEVTFTTACAEEPAIGEVVGEVRRVLAELPGVATVRTVQRWEDETDEPPDAGRPHSPLQAELLAEGIVPEPDPIGAAMMRPDIARETGYREEGPRPLDGPGGTTGDDAADSTYTGKLPVFQWEIDPEDEQRRTGESVVEDDDWEYRLWWQVHPEDLVYASIQAIGVDEVDHGGRARQHAVGRAVVVNLVYDLRREGVVAVYGTARDFRPFVEAFQREFDGPGGEEETSQSVDEE